MNAGRSFVQPKAAKMVIIATSGHCHRRGQVVGRQYIPPSECPAARPFRQRVTCARGGDQRPVLIQARQRLQRALNGRRLTSNGVPNARAPQRLSAPGSAGTSTRKRPSQQRRGARRSIGVEQVRSGPIRGLRVSRPARERYHHTGKRPLQRCARVGRREWRRAAIRPRRAAACIRSRRPPAG